MDDLPGDPATWTEGQVLSWALLGGDALGLNPQRFFANFLCGCAAEGGADGGKRAGGGVSFDSRWLSPYLKKGRRAVPALCGAKKCVFFFKVLPYYKYRTSTLPSKTDPG